MSLRQDRDEGWECVLCYAMDPSPPPGWGPEIQCMRLETSEDEVERERKEEGGKKDTQTDRLGGGSKDNVLIATR